ncbi:class A beta-lactamase [Phenylobacterium sp.]|jgi:beta-lactamase class A|uniref:class A beta-lactamase n=1 Tax=Phenylobacterium sp. TaxID=1871053 RepID=UPI002F922420
MPLTASTTPKLDMVRLNEGVAGLAARAAPGVLGVGLMNLESGEHFTFNGDRRFPMQSVFKAPLGAAALAEVDAGRLALDEAEIIDAQDLSPGWSPLAEAWPARRDYTLGELLTATVADSDNTAADVLMRRIGGPGAVTAWLSTKRLSEIRVDRYERELQPEVYGMASFRPAWKGRGFDQARSTVPEATRRAAMAAYMRDPRDTATPRAMLDFLLRLDRYELLSPVATRRMIEMMLATSRGNDRLKAGLPPGARFAHRPGTSGADLGLTTAFNDVGIITLPDRRSYAVAAFLSGATLSAEGQAGLFAELGRLVIASVG